MGYLSPSKIKKKLERYFFYLKYKNKMNFVGSNDVLNYVVIAHQLIKTFYKYLIRFFFLFESQFLVNIER